MRDEKKGRGRGGEKCGLPMRDDQFTVVEKAVSLGWETAEEVAFDDVVDKVDPALVAAKPVERFTDLLSRLGPNRRQHTARLIKRPIPNSSLSLSPWPLRSDSRPVLLPVEFLLQSMSLAVVMLKPLTK